MLGACDSLIGFLCTVIAGVALGFGFVVGQGLASLVGRLMSGRSAT